MPLTYKASSNVGDFAGLASGTYAAVCDIVADLGLQPGSGMYPEPKQQVYIRFEIPSERVEYQKDGKRVEGPAVIGNTYTASMNEKANLRKILQAWRGKVFSDEEAEAFDISAILGKACLLTVVENQKGDKTYSNIGSVGPLLKGMSAPRVEMTPILYCEDSPHDFGKLPEWLRKKIEGQLKKKVESRNDRQDTAEITDDDIPF
jgi:hypothetical protein